MGQSLMTAIIFTSSLGSLTRVLWCKRCLASVRGVWYKKVCVNGVWFFCLCFLSVCFLCVFPVCVFSLCFLSVCSVCVSLCAFSVCVFFACVLCLCFLSAVFLIRLRLLPRYQTIILLWSGLADQLLKVSGQLIRS